MSARKQHAQAQPHLVTEASVADIDNAFGEWAYERVLEDEETKNDKTETEKTTCTTAAAAAA